MPVAPASRGWLVSNSLTAAAVVLCLAGGGSALALDASPRPPAELASVSTEVVLRMETGGGLVPWGFVLTQAPAFSLYGAGMAVFRPTPGPTGSGLPPFLETCLPQDGVDALLAAALGPGGLADARDSYTRRGIADAPTTVFTVRAGGVDKTVSIYALGIGEGPASGPDAGAFEAFEDLARLLGDFGSHLADLGGSPASTYLPDGYAGFLQEADPGQPGAIPWPWPDLAPEDFLPDADRPWASRALLRPDQVAQVTVEPSGGATGILLADPGAATTFSLTVRPLLPDEVAGPPSPGPDHPGCRPSLRGPSPSDEDQS